MQKMFKNRIYNFLETLAVCYKDLRFGKEIIVYLRVT